MYSKEFCVIYDKYGWDYFSIELGNAILNYFAKENISVKNNLDLCCGVGTLCNVFDKNNIKSIGVDYSFDMINIAKNKYPHINFIREDVLKYQDKNKYDLITCTCDAINHFLNIKDVECIFNKVYELLNESGFFIFDIFDMDNMPLNEKIYSKRDNNVMVEYFITENNKLINTNVKVIVDNKLYYEENIKEKDYTKDEIINILMNIGFKLIKCDKKIYDEEQRFKDKLYIIVKK